MRNAARLGDHTDHGGEIITASDDVSVNLRGAARLGDLHACPIPGHGITEIVSGSPDTDVNLQRFARVGDVTGCGAVIVEGSPDVFVN